jgi:uncharacterized membrane protein
LFSGIGAIITGLGVILLLAYNWQAFPKFGKLGIILGGVALLQGVGLRLFGRRGWLRQLGEAATLLGTMLFGAGIWLVAQVYHIEEHYPNGFLLWGIGALALAWTMPSLAQALLAVSVLCIWGCVEGWGFDNSIHWGPMLILIGAGSLAWRLRSSLLLFFVLTAFVLTLCANVSAVEGELLGRVVLNFAVLFLAVGILCARGRWFSESAGAWTLFGWLGFLLCTYLLTFPGAVEGLLGWREYGHHLHGSAQVVYTWAPLILGLAAWGMVAWPLRPGAKSTMCPANCSLEHWLIPATALLCQVLAMARSIGSGWEVAGVFNLVFLAVAAAWMARGCREGLLRPTLIGSLLLVALVAARYFDLFESMAVRGLIFLMVGAVLIAEGILFRRARQQAQRGEVRG